MIESGASLPTKLWLDAHLAPLNAKGIFYYITHSGNSSSGLVLLKISDTKGLCTLLTQQRNLDGKMGWMHATGGADVEESEADAYISRAVSRDPDLWVVEIEDPNRNNPFEGDIF